MASLPMIALSCSGPDVTIVVGTQEFQEHSRELCCWSDYFLAAFRSGMEETRSMRFEFRDRDPEEWKLIRSLTRPFPSERVTPENMSIALSWFDELRCEHGLKECDRVLKATVLSIIHPQKSTSVDTDSMKANVDRFLETLDTSIQYGLEQTKQMCIASLVRVMEEVPRSLTEERLTALISCMTSDDYCCSILWDGLSRHLPESLANRDKDDLLQNEFLPALVSIKIQKDETSNQLQHLFRVSDWGSSSGFCQRVREDPVLRDVVPNDWGSVWRQASEPGQIPR